MAFTFEIKLDDATIAALDASFARLRAAADRDAAAAEHALSRLRGVLEMTQRGADRDGDYQYLRDAVLAFLEAFVR